MLNVDIPQASTITTWQSGIISVPLSAGSKFILDGLPSIQITRKTAALYRVNEGYFTYNVGNDVFSSGLVPTNPAKIQLSTTSAGGEYLLANPFVLGDTNPFPANSWRRAKNDDEPIYIIPSGQVDASGVEFLGYPVLNILCRFLISSINDRDFLANFAEGCI